MIQNHILKLRFVCVGVVSKNTDRESAINKPIINKNKIAVVCYRYTEKSDPAIGLHCTECVKKKEESDKTMKIIEIVVNSQFRG